MLFSQRIGKTPIKSIIQIDTIDDDLRNALWNELTLTYWGAAAKLQWLSQCNSELQYLFPRIWMDLFKKRIDEIPLHTQDYINIVRSFFFKGEWHNVYDMLEFIPNNYMVGRDSYTNNVFRISCNLILEREVSAFRFINDSIVQISSKEEIDSIEESLALTENLSPVKIHLNRAIELFSDRIKPDYRNSIKESISAVEAYCSILTGNTKATLGQALSEIEKNNRLHPALKKSFSILYGYTSDAEGIRHALMEGDNLYQEDAKFMLVACSAFINYLKQKDIKVER